MSDPAWTRASTWHRHEARVAWLLVAPALLVIAIVALAPVAWLLWESLHEHDLRMPWLGRPFVGVQNYAAAFADIRFLGALGHTGFFVVATVTLEVGAGLLMALVLNALTRGAGLVRTAVLLPWAIPTAVAALIWRFLFETPTGLLNVLADRWGLVPPTWFADADAAWLPLIVTDVWKTTPFVSVLLLAGLQNVDRTLLEAAAVDGATAWQRFRHVTLPMLRPALLVAFLFRTLDAVRVFDVVYVMTGGGPGTATEPLALFAFNTLLQNLRFGYGAALSVLLFAVAATISLATIALFGKDAFVERRR